MDKNQGKPCETCDHEAKSGGMYPCAMCRSSDKWVAKKFVGVEVMLETNEIIGDKESTEESRNGSYPLLEDVAGFSRREKRPDSLLALADEIAGSLISWRDGSGGSKDLRKAQRILTALIMLEEEDVED